MALDRSFIGRGYPPAQPYEVSRAKIREFADAIGDAHPVYRDPAAARAAGYPDVIAPPTFLTLINMRAIDAIVADPELGIDYGRMVHGSQKFSHRRPVHAGDQLVVHTTLDDISQRLGNDFVTVRAEVSDVDGEPVSTILASLVVRGVSE